MTFVPSILVFLFLELWTRIIQINFLELPAVRLVRGNACTSAFIERRELFFSSSIALRLTETRPLASVTPFQGLFYLLDEKKPPEPAELATSLFSETGPVIFGSAVMLIKL
jgi:hypothetical protein